ncbi:unnamed protein product [Mytilus coruscus]|uniref:MEGF10_11 n=1 Tax=Mytilus coruscus TaxID=42192 RepID=A0A6J8AU21_MYTCO|nr:unnamed protein product [Mytilus coruscus]
MFAVLGGGGDGHRIYRVTKVFTQVWLYSCTSMTKPTESVLKCKNGTTTTINKVGERCHKCDLNQYGYKCINKCDCDQFHRCNAEVGCILKASFSTTNTTYSEEDGVSKYYCTTLQLCNFICLTEPVLLPNETITTKETTFIKTGSNVTSQASHNETINFVFHERQSNTIGNIDDEAGYFDLYFAIEEDANDQLEDRASQKENLSISSSTSNVVSQDNTECPKLLQKYCQEDSHAFDVTVTVHQCIKRSSWSDEDPTSDKYSNICIPLLKDRQINSQANESHSSSESKTSHDTTLPANCTNKYAESEKTIDACCAIESNKDKSISEETF